MPFEPFTRIAKVGNRQPKVYAEHINELQRALEAAYTAAEIDATHHTADVVDGLIAAQGAGINARTEQWPPLPSRLINAVTHGAGLRSDSITATTMGAGQIRASLVYLGEEMTANEIGITVTTALGGGTIRLGIMAYDFGTSTGTLILDAGTVATDTTGDKTLAISETIGPGWYAIVALFSGSIGVQAGNPASGYGWSTSGAVIATPVQTGATVGPFGASVVFNTVSTTILTTWVGVA